MDVGSGTKQFRGVLRLQGCCLLVLIGSIAACAATASDRPDEHQLGDSELLLNGGSAGEGAESAPMTTSGNALGAPGAGGEAGAGNWQRSAVTGAGGGSSGTSAPYHDWHAAGSAEPNWEDPSNAQDESAGALIEPSPQMAASDADASDVDASDAGPATRAQLPGLQQCQDVCQAMSTCRGADVASCSDLCVASHWVESHGKRCLALRILWINEEGCERMLATYAAFSPGDRCD